MAGGDQSMWGDESCEKEIPEEHRQYAPVYTSEPVDHHHHHHHHHHDDRSSSHAPARTPGQVQAAKFLTVVKKLAPFQKLDKDGDGVLSKAEFQSALERKGLSLKQWQLADVFAIVDVNGDGRISVKELERIQASAQADAALEATEGHRARAYEFMRKLNGFADFSVYDTSGDGMLSRQEFAAAIDSMEMSLTQEQMGHLFSVIDVNNDNHISCAELQAIGSAPLSQSATKPQSRPGQLTLGGSHGRGGPKTHSERQNRKNALRFIQKINAFADFSTWDSSGDGFLSRDELASAVSKTCGEKLSDRQFNDLFNLVDANHDNKISLDEMMAFGPPPRENKALYSYSGRKAGPTVQPGCCGARPTARQM